jgi:dual specificity MAP kinase phosphatase
MSTLRDNREKRLRETCGATDAEIAYIKSIIQLKWQYARREATFHQQPSEILDSWLFQGNWKQANDSVILESLSITHIVNVTDRISFDKSRQILHIPSKDSLSVDLSKSFHETNAFLGSCHQQGCRALVHCQRGVSRSSTIILAYLMHYNKWTLLQAFEYLLTKRPEASPNHVLLLQLVRYENELTRGNDEK